VTCSARAAVNPSYDGGGDGGTAAGTEVRWPSPALVGSDEERTARATTRRI